METKKFLALALGALMLCPMAEAMSQGASGHLGSLIEQRTSFSPLKVAKKACVLSMLAGCGVGLWGICKSVFGSAVTMTGGLMSLFGLSRMANGFKGGVYVAGVAMYAKANGPVGEEDQEKLKKAVESVGAEVVEGVNVAAKGAAAIGSGVETGFSGLGLALKGFGWAVGSGLSYLALDYADMKLKE